MKSIIHNLSPIQKVLFSISIGLVPFIIANSHKIELIVAFLFFWIAFSITYISLSSYTFYTMKVNSIVKKAAEEDGTRLFVSFFLLIASLSCLTAVFFIIIQDSSNNISKNSAILTCIISIISSWILIHTIYVFHYAHLFYANSPTGKGLKFPDDELPDYLDFAYFSFGLGSTFQVSDIEVSSKKIRRIVLFHGLISFALNTFVVALSINIISGLIH